MRLKFIAVLILPLFLASCLEFDHTLKNESKWGEEFVFLNKKYESQGCRDIASKACLKIEANYPEMVAGPELLPQKVNREVERSLGKMLLHSFPYLSSKFPNSMIKELMNLYDYKRVNREESSPPQLVGMYGSLVKSNTDCWVFKLEVWVQNQGEDPIVQQKWVSIDKKNAQLVAQR